MFVPATPTDHKTRWRIFTLVLAFGLVMTTSVMLLMAKVHEEISQPFLERVDHQGMQAIHAHATPFLTHLALFLSWIGSPRELLPALTVVAIILWLRGIKRDTGILLVAVGGAGVIDTALKLHFKRIRPDVPWALVHEHSFSFPSGHSVAAIALYGIVTYLLWRHLHDLIERVAVITCALLLIIGIGLSRIYIGVHYPSDVAAGYLTGLLWLLSVISANEYVQRIEDREHANSAPST